MFCQSALNACIAEMSGLLLSIVSGWSFACFNISPFSMLVRTFLSTKEPSDV
uniref:Uncharacterized protein n=1 Tax=uncultured marine virus TaxID=186617 RepID=A0A0F7L7L0_9VIRU|nr:hypothetical protein [uncultured marine virus]